MGDEAAELRAFCNAVVTISKVKIRSVVLTKEAHILPKKQCEDSDSDVFYLTVGPESLVSNVSKSNPRDQGNNASFVSERFSIGLGVVPHHTNRKLRAHHVLLSTHNRLSATHRGMYNVLGVQIEGDIRL